MSLISKGLKTVFEMLETSRIKLYFGYHKMGVLDEKKLEDFISFLVCFTNNIRNVGDMLLDEKRRKKFPLKDETEEKAFPSWREVKDFLSK